MRKILTIAVAAAFCSSLVGSAAFAHSGNGCGLSGGKLEGECYTAALPSQVGSCDPDFDGEHTHVKTVSGASGGSTAFMPHSTCGISLAGVSFPGAALGLLASSYRWTTIQYRCSGSNGTFSITVTIVVSGGGVTSATVPCSPAGGLQTASLSGPMFSSGTRSVEIRYQASLFFLNFEVDYLGYSCATMGLPVC